MDCTKEELEKANVFQLSILIPLIKILDIYMLMKHELSPDEFCIWLFAREEPTGKCQIDYNPIKRLSVNLEEFKALSGSIQDGIVDLFMNITRYEQFLKSISKYFLNKRRRQNHDNLHETMVLVYILTYRIFALFFEDSVDCFNHFKIQKMLFLVSYLLLSETLNLFHEKGCLFFDEDFVEQKLVLPLLEATPCLERLQDQLKEELRKMEYPKKKPTTPLFMNVLNRPRRLKVPPPTPEDVAIMRFARGVPSTNYLKPSTETKLESLRAKHKLQAMNLLKDANEMAPSCSQHRKGLVKTMEEEKPKATFARRSIPKFKPVEVKQTAASILRECARVISDEEKEIKKLKELVEGGFDPASILKLEEEERQRKREAELLKIQEKHLLALLSREGAFIAKQSLLDDIKHHAKIVRKEKQELYKELEKWRENHNKEMTEIVERCHEIERASRDAFNAMVDEKRQKAAEVSEQSRQLKAQMIKQREEETQRKIKLIQEIKTIQSLRALPFKDFDPTESSGLGLFCEMSLAELKERLFWMKMKFNEEVENRKAVVQRERERQKNLIRDTQRALENYKANKRSLSSSKAQQQSLSVSSPEVDDLRKQLEERRALRLQKETVPRSK